MNIDIDFIDKWITLELAAALSEEPQPVGYDYPPPKRVGMYALFFPQTEYVYFGEAGDLAHAKANHIYTLRCQRHANPDIQQAYNDDPEGKILFFTILTQTREQARILLQQFLTAYEGQVKLLNTGIKE
jgi:hypothetical protein